ncbi:MAG: Rpn family recombination-promoting nuclease/putative transposase [Bacteroidales bacterium]|nr:Rpn family recombination-promoting nuclease/putative transposase [Bacteroidales bacterium]
MLKEFRYADLLDDDVFKLVFGRESSKEVMIEFLNLVIDDRIIIDLDFMDKEMKTVDRDKKNSTYDMFCRTDDGSRIIVEVQRRKQPFYPERALYYSTFQIQNQVDAGASNYDFLPVYVINILNFNLDVNKGNPEVKTIYRLYERNAHTSLTDRLTFIFIELRKFDKTISELTGNILEGIYFCLKHISSLTERPESLRHDIFRKIFEVSELMNMDSAIRQKVIEKMTTERDLKNQMDWALKEAIEEGLAEGIAKGRVEGRAEGRAEGINETRLEIAKRMLNKGMPEEEVADITALTLEELRRL